VITKVKSPAVYVVEVKNAPREWSRLAEKIRQVWRGMRAEIVYPSPSWRCSGCGHARLCGQWPAVEAVPEPLAASA
jgi:CRISPR/Cas system-associated exonuclease Cas4 (RecB family)